MIHTFKGNDIDDLVRQANFYHENYNPISTSMIVLHDGTIWLTVTYKSK